MQPDIQQTAPKSVQLNVVEVVTPSMDPVYMGALILALSLSTASVRFVHIILILFKTITNKKDFCSQNISIIQSSRSFCFKIPVHVKK